MKAIILAAGVGKRLGDSVTEHPKCLLDLGGRTLLERMLDALDEVGVRDITVSVGYLGEHPGSRLRHRYQVATVRQGAWRSPCRRKILGVGRSQFR